MGLLATLLLLLSSSFAGADEPPEEARRRAKAHVKQGTAHYNVGSWDLAIAEYQAAYDLAPNPDMLFNLAQANRMKGAKKTALELYQRFLSQRFEGPAADQAREHVAVLSKELASAPPPTPAPAPPPQAPPPPPAGSVYDPFHGRTTVSSTPAPQQQPYQAAEPAPPPRAPMQEPALNEPPPAAAPVPEPRDDRPIYKKGWFWGTMAGVAGAVVIVVALSATLGYRDPVATYGVVEVR
jgi:hypothetical protein